MNKKQLVETIAAKTGETKAKVEGFYEKFKETVVDALTEGDRVQLIGFGSFSVKARKERECINPQTKKKMIVPAKKKVTFKAGSALDAAVN